MDYISQKFIGIVGVRLEQFKKKGKGLWNCRCPLCGDSKKDKTKARGFIYEHDGDVMYKCHNCSVAMGFTNFLAEVDPNLKKQYILEKFGNKNKKVKVDKSEDFFKSAKPKFTKRLDGLLRVDKLPQNHPAKRYVDNRLIPLEQQSRLYYTDTFKSWTNTIVKNKFSTVKRDEARLIIPFFSEDDNLIAFQGRSLDPNNELRYITIKVDETVCKLFGLDKMDTSNPVYVLEGPIDSLFIPNSIAMAGADMNKKCVLDKGAKFVIVMDNENRNKEIVNKIESFIQDGFSVCIWDDNIKEKDVNDMVLNGMTSESIFESIKQHTYKGLQAKMALAKWSRV
jgi:DNA primase